MLVFSAPIRHTPALIAAYVQQSAGREQDRLWLDVTSLKEAPVQAMDVRGDSRADPCDIALEDGQSR